MVSVLLKHTTVHAFPHQLFDFNRLWLVTMPPTREDEAMAKALLAMQDAPDLMMQLEPPSKAPEWQHVYITNNTKGKDPTCMCRYA